MLLYFLYWSAAFSETLRNLAVLRLKSEALNIFQKKKKKENVLSLLLSKNLEKLAQRITSEALKTERKA